VKNKLICVVCPIGCRLKIEGNIEDLNITGNQCKRGIAFAKEELTNPTRMICTTVKIQNAIHKVLPVKTDKAIPEKYKLECVKEINKIELSPPTKMGDIIIKNIFGTGVNIVATRNM
jgi:CxxC motif-containing protein